MGYRSSLSQTFLCVTVHNPQLREKLQQKAFVNEMFYTERTTVSLALVQWFRLHHRDWNRAEMLRTFCWLHRNQYRYTELAQQSYYRLQNILLACASPTYSITRSACISLGGAIAIFSRIAGTTSALVGATVSSTNTFSPFGTYGVMFRRYFSCLVGILYQEQLTTS